MIWYDMINDFLSLSRFFNFYENMDHVEQNNQRQSEMFMFMFMIKSNLILLLP